MLYYIYYIILCYVILYDTILYYIIFYYILLYHIIYYMANTYRKNTALTYLYLHYKREKVKNNWSPLPLISNPFYLSLHIFPCTTQ